jgi:hypothetical protein
VAEDGVERLDDVRSRGSALGDLLRGGTALWRNQSREVGIERVGDVDDHLARQRVAELAHERYGVGVGHGEDDYVAGRGCADRPRRGAADHPGQSVGLGSIAADDLDRVAARECTAAQGAGHVPRPDDADPAHGVRSLSSSRSFGFPR